MSSTLQASFLELVRLGIGVSEDTVFSNDIEWGKLKVLADEQGLFAIVLDGIEKLPDKQRPPQVLLLEWIGEVLQGESVYELQRAVAVDMANLFYNKSIRPYVLKGNVISECYPKPSHRVSVDIDCILLPDKGEFDAWSLGNDLIHAKGVAVNTDYYKNSSFDISGVIIENHLYLAPFRGNACLTSLEMLLQSYLRQDKGEDVIEGTHLYRPPVMVTALFLIEHAYSHFLHEGLTWRMVLDWLMFSKKHKDEINWAEFEAYIEQFGFRKFYGPYARLGLYLLSDLSEDALTKIDRLMVDDIWAPLDLHDTVRGLKGKLALAGNTWRARWKYRYFTEISWVKALWIQVKGFLFIKEPKLN